MRSIKKFILDGKVESVLAIIGTLSMIWIMFFNVITRFIFNFSYSWTDEAVRYFNLIAVFAGISLCFRDGSHIIIDTFIEDVIPKSLRKYFRLLSYVLSLLFCLAIGYYGFKLTLSQIKLGQVSTALSIPMYILYGLIPAGMTLSAIQIMEKIFVTKSYLNDPRS